MPRKILRSQSQLYPFGVELHITRVSTSNGNGTIINRINEWIFVKLDRNDQIVKTNIFLADLIENA
jgi:hypothetical protein